MSGVLDRGHIGSDGEWRHKLASRHLCLKTIHSCHKNNISLSNMIYCHGQSLIYSSDNFTNLSVLLFSIGVKLCKNVHFTLWLAITVRLYSELDNIWSLTLTSWDKRWLYKTIVTSQSYLQLYEHLSSQICHVQFYRLLVFIGENILT